MKKLAILLAALSLCVPVLAQTSLRTTVRQLQGNAALKNATWGVLAVRLRGDTLAAYNADKRMVPASNVKVITAGTALHLLGADYRFRTDLAYSGKIVDGVLQGNLYILGGGDPTTASKYDCAIPMEQLFAQWKKLLEDAGIRSIDGTIVGDGRGWGGRVPCKDWSGEDLGFYYGAAPGALNFYENAQDLTVAPSDTVGKPVRVTPFFPEAPWMIFNHAAITGSQGSGDQLLYSASDAGPFGRMYGKFAVDRKSKVEECINHFPEYTCAYYFHNYLIQSGMDVTNAFAEVSPYGRIRRDMFLYDDGEEAVAYAEAENYDGMILDWMMPEKDGIQALREIRKKGIQTPCLFLTARDAVEDRVTGLDAGADDYLPKPFDAGELMARVRAMLRRRESYVPDTLQWEDLTLDKGSCELRCGEKSVRITGKMFQLAELFMENPRILFSVQQLMDKVWGWDTEAEINVVWVNISQLRKKLSDLDTAAEIRVHRGTGYSLEKKADDGEKE